MIEIERKFLVRSHAFKDEATTKDHLIQGFLNTDPYRTVRVRLVGAFGYLTIKGKSDISGISRFEWEKEITPADVKSLLKLCEEGIIEKTRYGIPIGNHVFEVDEFHGANAGLVIAEVELDKDTEAFDRPSWLGREVTGEVKYYNSQLSKKPFTKW